MSLVRIPWSLSAWRAAAVPMLLVLALLVFIANSHPMMRPGFDIWWHLGMIDAPDRADPSVFSFRRLLWHHAWHGIFEILQISDVFARALVIHRTQLLITSALLILSAYLVLRALTAQTPLPRQSLFVAAWLSSLTWALMHGTFSTAHGGGAGSQATLSWLMWYSVTYQISLPLYFAAAACLLYAVCPHLPTRLRALAAGASLLFATLCTLVHAAETAYYLWCVAIVVVLYARPKNNPWTLIALGGGALLGAWLATRVAYLSPALVTLIVDGRIDELQDEIRKAGTLMVDAGYNRLDTGWHAMHWAGLLGLLAGAALLSRTRSPGESAKLDRRPQYFIALTAVMPALLASRWGAGLLAQITYVDIAWRFSLASFLFVGLPWGTLLLLQTRRGRSVDLGPGVGHGALIAITVLILVLVLMGSKLFESQQPSYRFAQSLHRSLHPSRINFGLSEQEQQRLKSEADALRQSHTPEPTCTSIRSAYHLFFVERYRGVVLPPALQYLPFYRAPSQICDFPQGPKGD